MSSTLPTPSLALARALPLEREQIATVEPFALFQQQMSANTEAAVDAMKRLLVVAVAMEDVSALVPYLVQLVQDQSDEILLLLGQQLPAVAEYMDAPAVTWLPLLERLLAVEETVVRNQAVVVLEGLLKKETNAGPWIALVKRLASADWFTAKVSAAGVVPSVLRIDGTAELLSLYRDLCMDETPMVRRAAATHIGHVLAATHAPELGATMVPQLCRDEQDSVRLLAISSLAQVKEEYGKTPAWAVQNWVPLIQQGVADKSWRVRNNLAKNFSDVANNMGIHQDAATYAQDKGVIMDCFVTLLADAEAEVRSSATTHWARMVQWGGESLFHAHLLQPLPVMADDVSMDVRSKCALAVMDAADSGVLEDTVIIQNFGPLLESFLGDEFHEVQLQVLTNLHKISRLLPALSGVVSKLLQMSKAGNWRVREAVAQLLPHLAEARGLEFFSTVLFEPAWLVLLMDPVATVRKAIVTGMGLLVQVAGPEWICQTLFPKTLSLYQQYSNQYLVRSTIVRTYIEAALAHDDVWKEAVPVLLRGLEDSVPNVRMTSATGLGRMLECGDANMVQAQVRPALERQAQQDTDADCRHACAVALGTA